MPSNCILKDHLLPPALLLPGAAAAAREEGRHGCGEAVGSSDGLAEAGRRAGVAVLGSAGNGYLGISGGDRTPKHCRPSKGGGINISKQKHCYRKARPWTDDFANNNRYIYCSSANPNTVEDLSYYPLTQHPGLPLPGCEGLETAILQVVVSGLLVGTIAPFVNNLYSATWSFLNFLCTNFVLLLHVTGKLRQLNYIFSFISRSH